MKILKDIIRSRFASKESIWYQKRLEICLQCPLWSDNKNENSLQDYGWKIANLGKAHCTECGCPENKLRLKNQECPIGKWGKVTESNMKVYSFNEGQYELENLSEDKVKMTESPLEVLLEYGTIKVNSDTKISILIKPQTEVAFANMVGGASCGCTTPTILQQGKDVKLNISYDSRRLGDFSKLVTLNYTTDKPRQIKFRIKGKVVK